MTTILQINASARMIDDRRASGGSISRMLAGEFYRLWQQLDERAEFIHRDVGSEPPAFISEAWIAAVFTPEEARTVEQRGLLAQSDALIDELTRAEVVVIASPMYNYGMPASLKAWFDQVIRINKTFTFDLARGDQPLQPTLSGKTLVLLAACGEFGFGEGELRGAMNHLSPHVRTLGRYLGVSEFHEIRVEYQEFGDERHRESLASAKSAIERLVAELVPAAALSPAY